MKKRIVGYSDFSDAEILDRSIGIVQDFERLAMERLNVMRGPSHNSRDEMLQENSVVSAVIYSCSGGDW